MASRQPTDNVVRLGCGDRDASMVCGKGVFEMQDDETKWMAELLDASTSTGRVPGRSGLRANGN